MYKIYQRCVYIFCLTIGALFLSSCGSTPNVVYLSNLDSLKYVQIPKAAFKQPLIQVDDILNVTIQTQDVTDPSAFNQTSPLPGGATSSEPSAAAAGSAITGFLVDEEGNIEIPIIGAIKVAELTTNQAKNLIKTRASKYYKDPTVQVRFANYKVTVLGEVAKPAAYVMPNEKVTIFDAISLAGDLTISGKRNNVMLMRDNGDKKDIIRLDLTSSEVVASPYYYLKQNDVIYVEPSKAKVGASNAPRTQLITVGVAIATLLITIFR
jgi:polysaccharide export outer membrane protein